MEIDDAQSKRTEQAIISVLRRAARRGRELRLQQAVDSLGHDDDHATPAVNGGEMASGNVGVQDGFSFSPTSG